MIFHLFNFLPQEVNALPYITFPNHVRRVTQVSDHTGSEMLRH